MTHRAAPNYYRIHGLSVCSQVPLDAPVGRHEVPDIEVLWGAEKIIPCCVPPGVLVQEYTPDDEGYACAKTEAGYTIRFFGCCEFQINAGLSTVVVHRGPDVDPRWAALLLGGNVLGFILMLSGKTVLHASAVERNDRALAFVGASGMGKSTLATLFCLQGHKLLTDDVLRIDFREQAFVCFPGTVSTRLRPGSAVLAEQFPEGIRKESVDQRTCIRLQENFSTLPLLGAIVVPKLSRKTTTARVKRLSPREAFLSLSRYPRILGLKDRHLIGSQFHTMSQVAKELIVYAAEIPWVHRVDSQLPAALLETLKKALENDEHRAVL